MQPIVEVQFADYLARSESTLHGIEPELHAQQRPTAVHSLIRVPIGAYGSGGPYHSSSIESVLANIRGIKAPTPPTAPI